MLNKRTRHTAPFLLSHFLNSKESLELTWLTATLVSILRYMFDVIEMTYARTNLSICDKSISQIAKYARTSPKSVKRGLPLLVKHGFLSIEKKKPRTPTHFGIGNLLLTRVTMTPDYPQADSTGVTMTPALGSPRPQISPNWGHSDPLVIKSFNKDSKKERARKERAPLSPSFEPTKSLEPLIAETASKSGKSPAQLLAKFKNIQKSKDGMSLDWNAEYENFLLNERPMGYLNGGNGKGHSDPRNGETRNTVLAFDDPRHPNYEFFMKRREERLAQEKLEMEKNQAPTEHISFKEAKRRYELNLKQQGELSNGNISNHNGRGNDS